PALVTVLLRLIVLVRRRGMQGNPHLSMVRRDEVNQEIELICGAFEETLNLGMMIFRFGFWHCSRHRREHIRPRTQERIVLRSELSQHGKQRQGAGQFMAKPWTLVGTVRECVQPSPTGDPCELWTFC